MYNARLIQTQSELNANPTHVTLELIAKNQNGILAATAQVDANVSKNSNLFRSE